MYDYLIIGSGLAGIAFAEIALNNNKSIFVIDNNSQNSSKIAGGLYNPVVLKRFTEVQHAKEQLSIMREFYTHLQLKLNSKFDYNLPIYRKIFSIEEQNNWFYASDNENLVPFLSTNLIHKKYSNIHSPFGFGEVLQTGYVDTALLIKKYREYLKLNDIYSEESFDYIELKQESYGLRYKDFKAKHILFAEGFGLHANPFFNYLPLDGTKGELFIIKAVDLNLDVILNSSLYIIPLGNNIYKVGATYNWNDKTNEPTQEGKSELIQKIREVLQCDFEILNHFAGVRPTVIDRKPLVGTHSKCQYLHILNGLGTRGVMLAPALAKALFEKIEYNTPLDSTIDIKRFDKLS